MTGWRSARVEAARSALSRGDLGAVHRFATTLVAENSDDAEGHFLLGIAESNAGLIRPGIRHLGRAVVLDPQGEYRAHLAKLFTLLRQDGDAATMLRDAEQALPAVAPSRDTMGCVYARLGDHAAALIHFAEELRHEQSTAPHRDNQAEIGRDVGRDRVCKYV